MANCNKLFLDFCKEITPTFDQMQKMKTSRKKLEGKISEKIKEELGVNVSFYTQGSGSPRMRTIIIKVNGTYDADRGIYLPEKPKVTSETVQKYVLDAVKDHTDGGAQHRKKCIRVLYKCAYNIDFPVYYEVPNESYSYLALKGNEWIKDDPSKLIEWFEKLKDSNGQLIRIIKYLKAWASKCSFKMPSGIALTVWAAGNFTEVKDRDDECLLAVLKKLKEIIDFSITCYSPVEPFDDFTSKLSPEQKNKFKTEVSDFCSDAQKAVDSDNQKKSSKIWCKYFGERFQEGADEDVDKKASVLMESAGLVLSQNAQLNRQGNINQSSGVQHQNHRNFGS